MLATSWCSYCKAARHHLTAMDVAWCEFDVEASAEGAKRYAAVGSGGVPIFLRRGAALRGFSAERLDDFIAATEPGLATRATP